MEDKMNCQDALKKQSEELEEKHLLDTVRMLEAFKERFGSEILEVVDKLTAERSRKEGEELAKSLGSNTIQDIIKELWVAGLPLGLEYTSEKLENGMQMKCTRCYIYETARKLGITEWAYHLFCVGDPYFVEGFNPKMGFSRTKSLMEGHDHCNHYFYTKE
jgi:hypothetical protein